MEERSSRIFALRLRGSVQEPLPEAMPRSCSPECMRVRPGGPLRDSVHRASYTAAVFETLIKALEACPDIGYALVFGSFARGTLHGGSDLDIAIGGMSRPLSVLELGDLIGRLEAAAGRDVDLVLLDEAPVGLAFRVFRDGKLIVDRDHDALARRKARAALDYFDFKPVEDLFLHGGKGGRAHGR